MKLRLLGGFLVSVPGGSVRAQEITPTIVQGSLTQPGQPPFHLVATITERADPNEHGQIEMYWINPQKWRRTIQSQDFSQTLIVNGNQTFEQTPTIISRSDWKPWRVRWLIPHRFGIPGTVATS